MSQRTGTHLQESLNQSGEGGTIQEQVDASLRLTFPQRLLVVLTLSLTLLVLICAGGVIALLISHQHEEFVQQFASHREALKEEIDRHEASIRQLAASYGMAKEYLIRSDAQARQVQSSLARTRTHTVPTSPNTQAFSVISSLTSPRDTDRLADLINLSRYASTFSLAQLEQSLAISQGFIYTPDKRFLSTFPPLFLAKTHPLHSNKEAEAFIASHVNAVEDELKEDTGSADQDRILWVTGAKDSVSAMTTTYFSTSLYESGHRIATIVSAIPCNRFNQYFLHDHSDPHFLVIACKLQRLLGVDETSSKEMRWAQIISRTPWMYRVANDRPQRIWREGSFFILQRVPGPAWVAVYAYTWYDLLGALKWELLIVMLCTLGGCGIVVAGAWGINREVIRPAGKRLQSLLESEAFSRSVIQVAPVSLAVIGRADGTILLQNSESLSLQHAFADGQKENGDAANIFERAGTLVRHHERITSGFGKIQRFEMEPDLEIAYAQAKYCGDEVFVVGVVDLAKRKEIERRLRESRRRALDESREKGMFLATMSHEIRTPLHGALGNLELLSRMGLTQEQHSRLAIAQESFGALLSLINGVLDLSRIEAGQLTLEERAVQLDELVEQACRTFSVDAQKNGVRILCLIDPSTRGTWLCDGSRFMQIATNLIGNAVKFTAEGSITVALSQAAEGRVSLRVADSGRGIPEDELDQIFAPYVQGTQGSKSSRAGTGLGLALCQKIIARMGGQIVVESEIGVGTIFTVALPLRRDAITIAHQCPERPLHFLVNCDIPSWRNQLVAQLRAWFPESSIDRVSNRDDYDDTLLTLCVDAYDRLECDRIRQQANVDRRIVIALDGPLVPVTTANTICISGYSARLLREAIDTFAAGPDVHVSAPAVPMGPMTTPIDEQVHMGARVLVIEDDVVSARLMRDQLRILGVEHVEVAPTAEDGELLCRTGTYHLVITDANLPGKGGVDFLSALRSASILWPVVLCTADATVPASTRSLFNGVIIKPATLQDLSQVLTNVLHLQAHSPQDASPPLDSLLQLFAQAWARDQVELDALVSDGNVTGVLDRLHRIKGGLQILSGDDIVCILEDWAAAIRTDGVVSRQDYRHFVDAVANWLAGRTC